MSNGPSNKVVLHSVYMHVVGAKFCHMFVHIFLILV